jgi:glucose/arabinose dehydrogenase
MAAPDAGFGNIPRRDGGSVKRLVTALALASLALFGACRWLLPERFAVNAPLGHLLLGRSAGAPPAAAFGSRIRAAPGFAIDLFAESVDNARLLRVTPAGHVLVSQPRKGRVLLLEPDADGDGRSDARRVVLEGLNRPHGMDLHEGRLYVAEGDAVGRVRFDPIAGRTLGPFERVVTGLPAGGNHWTRTLRFGPDGWMYVAVGSSCNVCLEQDPRRAAILRYRPDGSGEEIFATGLRNAVGFDWRPGTDELHATDNGRDLLGDDFPPCELNRVVRGGFYGWPFANGANVPDPDFGAGRADRIASAIAPVHDFRPHNAPLGIVFVRHPQAPPALRDAALVALHGSWNRTRKDGYKVVSLHWRGDGRIEERDFVVGFLEDEHVIGRPVDVAEAPDGSFYVSDDYAGAVYRVVAGADSGRGAASASAASRGDPLAALAPAEHDERAERGRRLWLRHECARCHDASSAPPGVVPVSLEGLAARHSIESIEELLAAPTPPMPLAPLAEEERRDLAVFLLSTRR